MRWTRDKLLAPILIVLGLSSVFYTSHAAFCLPTSTEPCWPSRTTLAEFANSLTENSEVINPDRTPDRFSSEATSMNSLKGQFPGLIVIPGSESDLRKAVVFANSYRIRIVVRCSGHDFNGRSTGRGVMLIKTERLKSITFDEGTNTIQFAAGANHGDIYEFLEPYQRVYPGGQSRTVCPAGCLAGGCHGPLSRQYGLGIDSIVEIRLVLFNGTLVTATKTSNAALFHAYLGAGQNSFAIAVSFRAKTYPAPPAVLSMTAQFSLFNPKKPGKAYANIFTDYFMNLGWLESVPRELSGYLNLIDETVTVQFIYTGSDVVDAWNALEGLLGSPYVQDLSPISNYSTMYDFAVNNYPPASEIWQRKFIANAFVDPDQYTMDELTQLIVQYKPYLWMWFVFGGAVSEGTVGSVPDGMRNAVCQVVLGTQWFDPNEDEVQMDSVNQLLGPLYDQCPSSYSNEWTTWGNVYNVMNDWKTRFYKNYDSLMAVKKKYDPCNVFSAKYGVGSDQILCTC